MNFTNTYLGNCCGNSFLIFDCRHPTVSVSRTQRMFFAIKYIPRLKVDSALFLHPSPIADLRFEIFEKDGSESDTCGNGMLLLTYFLKIAEGTIESKAGIFPVSSIDDFLSVKLLIDDIKIESYAGDPDLLFVRSGEPHLVKITDRIDSNDLISVGASMQKQFLHGINLNHVRRVSENTFEIQTFERGVNSITLSCGTGVLASYTALNHLMHNQRWEMLEFRSTGGTHWLAREGDHVSLRTVHSACTLSAINLAFYE